MRILIVSATPFEVQPLVDYANVHWVNYEPLKYQKGKSSLDFLITGVGIPNTIFHLTRSLLATSYDLIINAGIAGAFDPATELGSVWNVVEDRFGDLGVEEADGNFVDVFEMELQDANSGPFQAGKIINPASQSFQFLPRASAITVNKVHGSKRSIAAIKDKYSTDLESMEGAAFFYVCQQLKVNFLQIRSASNIVEPRNRENWNIPLAIKKLNEVLVEMLNLLS